MGEVTEKVIQDFADLCRMKPGDLAEHKGLDGPLHARVFCQLWLPDQPKELRGCCVDEEWLTKSAHHRRKLYRVAEPHWFLEQLHRLRNELNVIRLKCLLLEE
jgi:hypothetical protein